MERRTAIGLTTAAAGLGGVATWVYRQAPAFWKQYFDEMSRPIARATHSPDPRLWPDKGVHGAWLGHSTVLLKVDGFTLITDPVFSDRVGLSFGPVTVGVKRFVEPALALDRLPRLDLILLSHAHFDHFDTPTLGSLESKLTSVVTASRTSDLLNAWRYRNVRELAWGERAQVGPASLRAIEVNHWGARMRTDTYRGYNGYVIEIGRHRILFAGDTAITDAFRQVKSSQPFDLAIMPIGAYQPWIRYHCTPEEAWRMGEHAGADRYLPVHHQTFPLSREPYFEPIGRFHAAAGSSPDRIVLREIGREFAL
ncbi:MAG: MBL fold metallo-hydrolase [Bryobacteraceae bacterium]